MYIKWIQFKKHHVLCNDIFSLLYLLRYHLTLSPTSRMELRRRRRSNIAKIKRSEKIFNNRKSFNISYICTESGWSVEYWCAMWLQMYVAAKSQSLNLYFNESVYFRLTSFILAASCLHLISISSHTHGNAGSHQWNFQPLRAHN